MKWTYNEYKKYKVRIWNEYEQKFQDKVWGFLYCVPLLFESRQLFWQTELTMNSFCLHACQIVSDNCSGISKFYLGSKQWDSSMNISCVNWGKVS